MRADDLSAVSKLAARIHPAFPEDDAVFAERLRLYPDGCRVYTVADVIAAYVISHPWRPLDAPPLNSLLGELPPDASAYYIHDLALGAQVRGTGTAAAIIDALADHARETGYSTMSLVAVNASTGFWRRQGFAQMDISALADKLRSYGDADAQFMMRTL